MKITVCKGALDTWITQEKIWDISLPELAQTVSEPFRCEKHQAPYWLPFDYHIPGLRQCCSRSQDNAISIHWLVLDVEKSISIDCARQKLTEFDYVLYTTARHNPDNHRFRIWLPLANPMPITEYLSEPVNTTLKRVFNWTDPATLKHIGFYAPVSTPYYQYHMNENGESIDLYDKQFLRLYKVVEDNLKHKTEEIKHYERKDNLENYLEHFKRLHTEGQRHNITVVLFSKLKCEMGYTLTDAIMTYRKTVYNPLPESELKSIYKSNLRRSK